MCMGKTHAAAGLAAGLAVGEFVTHAHPLTLLTLTGLTAGAAVLPDIDHPNSTMAHSFGFVSHAIAEVVGKVSGGHRKLTHSLAGIALLTAGAWAAVHWRHDVAGRIGLFVLLALILDSAAVLVPVRWLPVSKRRARTLFEVAAVLLAVSMAVWGWGLALVALATAVGAAAHIAVDMLTDKGCPLLYGLSRRPFRWWGEPMAFTTQTRPETAALAAFLGLAGALAVYAAFPSLCLAALTGIHHAI